MHFGKLLFLGFLFWLIVLAEKYIFFAVLGFSAAWQLFVYYLLLIIFSRIFARRFGVINFLEAIFTALVWLLIILFLDYLFAKSLISTAIFRTANYWWSYLAIFVSVFFLHKKRHIHVRKELRAHKH